MSFYIGNTALTPHPIAKVGRSRIDGRRQAIHTGLAVRAQENRPSLAVTELRTAPAGCIRPEPYVLGLATEKQTSTREPLLLGKVLKNPDAIYESSTDQYLSVVRRTDLARAESRCYRSEALAGPSVGTASGHRESKGQQ